MAIIRELDLKWFWIGYTAGVNSRKRLVESPNKIVNLGKQGVLTTLTDKQKISFFIGVKMGRGKIVQNFDVVRIIQYQDKNAHKSNGEYLTAEIGSIETSKGATFSLPFYISNNSVDNRGYIGYQYKIKYPHQYMTLNTITSSSSWQGSFEYQHDAENGIVLVQGINDVVSYDDVIFGYLNFTLKEDTPNKMTVYLQGPTGKGTGTDILTYFNDTYYYIQPIRLKSGKVVIIEEDEPKPPDTNNIYPSIYLPPIGSSSDTISPDSEFTYDFDCDLRYVGDGEGSGADLVIKITFGDGTSTTVRIPLEEGEHHYNGKIPIKLPSMTTGPVQIEMWVEPEDPDDVYYWFIKAGALWGFETTIPREEVNQLPIIMPKVTFFDGFRIKGDYRISWVTEGEEPEEDRWYVNEILHIIGDYRLSDAGGGGGGTEEGVGFDDLGISDGFRITFEGGLS